MPLPLYAAARRAARIVAAPFFFFFSLASPRYRHSPRPSIQMRVERGSAARQARRYRNAAAVAARLKLQVARQRYADDADTPDGPSLRRHFHAARCR